MNSSNHGQRGTGSNKSFHWAHQQSFAHLVSMPPIVPTENDVLSGRGVTVSNSPGNRRFRVLVRAQGHRYPDYLQQANERKTRIAQEILAYIRQLQPPGRFLKEKSKGKGSGGRRQKGQKIHWIEMDGDETLKKTRQALRDYFRPDRVDYGPRDVPLDEHLNEFARQTTRSGISSAEGFFRADAYLPPGVASAPDTASAAQMGHLTTSTPVGHLSTITSMGNHSAVTPMGRVNTAKPIEHLNTATPFGDLRDSLLHTITPAAASVTMTMNAPSTASNAAAAMPTGFFMETGGIEVSLDPTATDSSLLQFSHHSDLLSTHLDPASFQHVASPDQDGPGQGQGHELGLAEFNITNADGVDGLDVEQTGDLSYVLDPELGHEEDASRIYNQAPPSQPSETAQGQTHHTDVAHESDAHI